MVIIHLVRTQNFRKNYYFLPPNTHTLVCLSGGKNGSFWELTNSSRHAIRKRSAVFSFIIICQSYRKVTINSIIFDIFKLF